MLLIIVVKESVIPPLKATSFYTLHKGVIHYTANVCRELQGLCRDFKFMGIACIPAIPVILKFPHSDFIVIFAGINFYRDTMGFPALNVGKLRNNLIFWRYPCKICRDFL